MHQLLADLISGESSSFALADANPSWRSPAAMLQVGVFPSNCALGLQNGSRGLCAGSESFCRFFCTKSARTAASRQFATAARAAGTSLGRKSSTADTPPHPDTDCVASRRTLTEAHAGSFYSRAPNQASRPEPSILPGRRCSLPGPRDDDLCSDVSAACLATGVPRIARPHDNQTHRPSQIQ